MHTITAQLFSGSNRLGMIQQDCMGYGRGEAIIQSESDSGLVVNRPDEGIPPTPERISESTIVANEPFGPQLYDGVDCAKLESYYRPASEQTSIEVDVAPPAPSIADQDWQFHRSYFAACSCDFELKQAAQAASIPNYVFKRICIEDYFAKNLVSPQVSLGRDASSLFAANKGPVTTPLAVAVPAVTAQSKARLADALSHVATWTALRKASSLTATEPFSLKECCWTSDLLVRLRSAKRRSGNCKSCEQLRASGE